ncbi:HAD-IA family hydrolase [Methylocapsa acidiphila]|uniref:HAD-IA family hydrolase n=1 Tax=Methylocapsa acidiphila TaxID=133552 RepID=UPI000400BA82|nr:HAD-IA family hydrolase [Methylocapsa acidiphila]
MKLVIFDIDGTLVDSQELLLEAQRRAFEAHRLEAPSRAKSLSIVGLSLREAFTTLAGEHGPVESLAQAYRDAWTAMRAEPGVEAPLYPGAAETIAALAKRDDLMLGIATGKARRGVDYLLDRHGWRACFSTVQTADEHPSKPAPDMILSALADVGAAPEATYMIGDTTYDMEMARAAEVHPIGVAWGYHTTDELRAAGAERIVADFGELLHLIKGRA